MKILIFTDLEGASGIGEASIIETDDPELENQQRKFLTGDVNAAIRGLRKAGASHIDIFDGHGMGGNINIEELETGVNYLGGGWMTKLRKMVLADEIKSYDAFVLLGQHAAQGTPNGFLSHTNTGVSALKLNGQFVGEAPQIAWLAGYFGVPVLMIVGDDATSREVETLLPGVKTVIVKESESRTSAHCIPVDEVHAKIEETARERLTQLNKITPFNYPNNEIEVGIFFASEEAADMLAGIVNFNRSDERVVTYQAADYLEAFFAYHSCRPVIQASYLSLFWDWFKGKDIYQEIRKEFIPFLEDKYRDTSDLFPVVRY